MKLVMTLLVRDEEDIVDANLRFHLNQGVDFVIATDNRSVDGTADILKGYEQAGCLQYIHEPSDDYSQARWVTRMARLAATEHRADWVINADADEFWWPKSGDLKAALGQVPNDDGFVSARRVNFIPRPPGEGQPLDRMTVREVRSLNAMGRPLPAKVCHRGLAEIEVAQGNHQVTAGGLGSQAQTEPIVILHFPLRSYRQFESKIVSGGRAYEANVHLPEHVGSTWRKLYDTWKEGGLEAHYQDQQLDGQAIEAGIAAGDLILDRRVQRLLADGRDFIDA